MTVTRENFKDYKNIIDAYVELWLNNIFLRWLNPYGFAAADLKNLAYKEEEWVEFYQKSLDYILELNKKWVQIKEITSIIFLKKILASSDPSFMDIRSPSGIAIGWVAYNFDGKVYASDESRMLWRMWIQDFLMTDMLEDGKKTYEAMMNSDICKIAVQSSCLDGLPGYNDHVYKPYMGVDIIHNFKMYGSIYQPMATDSKTRIFESVIDYLFYKIKNNPEEKEILYKWAQ